jgi:CRP-like cAMP-binding protein
MNADETAGYRVWGKDRTVYGPFDPPTLRAWVNTARVTADTWVFADAIGEWKRAAEFSELKPLFSGDSSGQSGNRATRALNVDPKALRRVKLFESFTDVQLGYLGHYFEVVRVPQFANIVLQGQYGDAMYVVLEGELRAITVIDQRESILGTMRPGDVFGEISVLDQGPRSADVIANRDSVLLKLSSAAFDRLIREAPALALPFSLGITREVVERLRRSTKRYEDTIRFIRASSAAKVKA